VEERERDIDAQMESDRLGKGDIQQNQINGP